MLFTGTLISAGSIFETFLGYSLIKVFSLNRTYLSKVSVVLSRLICGILTLMGMKLMVFGLYHLVFYVMHHTKRPVYAFGRPGNYFKFPSKTLTFWQSNLMDHIRDPDPLLKMKWSCHKFIKWINSTKAHMLKSCPKMVLWSFKHNKRLTQRS